jgi:chromosome segregation ATPase
MSINPLSSPDRAHTSTYVITLYGGVDYFRQAQRVKRETQKELLENNNEIKLFNPNEEQNEKIENYKTQISELKNENYSLIKTVNNLKNEIRIYKIQLDPTKKDNENNLKDDKDLIKNITEEMNKWKQGYFNLSKVNDILKEKLSKIEKNLDLEEEIKYLKEVLYKKDKLLMDLTLQIKEYQSKSDDIILGKTKKDKDKQIEILLNEVKGIRKRLLNIVTSNDRINNFDDFINNIKIIQNCENKIKDKEAKKALEKLKLYIDEYILNNDMAYNEFLAKLYSN